MYYVVCFLLLCCFIAEANGIDSSNETASVQDLACLLSDRSSTKRARNRKCCEDRRGIVRSISPFVSGSPVRHRYALTTVFLDAPCFVVCFSSFLFQYHHSLTGVFDSIYLFISNQSRFFLPSFFLFLFLFFSCFSIVRDGSRSAAESTLLEVSQERGVFYE